MITNQPDHGYDNTTFLSPTLLLPEWLNEMKGRVSTLPPQALLDRPGKRSEEWNFEKRGNTAIVKINGILTLRMNVWSSAYDWTTYEGIALGLNHLIHSPDIDNIVFWFNSPGGNIFGLEEMVDKIFQARGKKRLIGFAQGYCASAAFWLYSACETRIAAPGAWVGSVGTKVTVTDWSAFDQKSGIQNFTFVSKQSPNKIPDPSTSKGAQLYQQLVDEGGARFVSGIARNYNVDEKTVLEDFGKGWILDSRQAVQSGLTEYEAGLEDVLHALSKTPRNKPIILNSIQEANNMDETTKKELQEMFQTLEQKVDKKLEGVIKSNEDTVSKIEAVQKTISSKSEKGQGQNAEGELEAQSSPASPKNEVSQTEPKQPVESQRTVDDNQTDYKTLLEKAQQDLKKKDARIKELEDQPTMTAYQKEHGSNSSDDSPGW